MYDEDKEKLVAKMVKKGMEQIMYLPIDNLQERM